MKKQSYKEMVEEWESAGLYHSILYRRFHSVYCFQSKKIAK